MASLCTRKNKRTGKTEYEIQINVLPGNRRPTIRLGAVSQGKATAFKVRVDALEHAYLSGGSPDPDTSRWLASLPEKTYNRLAAIGFAQRREHTTLGRFYDSYVAKHAIKPATKVIYAHARQAIMRFFGEDRSLRDVTPGDAKDFVPWALAEGGVNGGPLSKNTVATMVGRCKAVFNAAVDHELITRNPFRKVSGTVTRDPKKIYFVSQQEVQALIEATRVPELQLCLILARYCGFRIPSEIRTLKWVNVNFEKMTILVESPKTERYPNGQTRICPIFPEVYPYLRDAFERASPGATYVFERYRTGSLWTPIKRLFPRAGIQPWPRVYCAMRASRSTELKHQGYLEHVVLSWIGHTEKVALKHYDMERPEDRQRAVAVPTPPSVAPGHIPGREVMEAAVRRATTAPSVRLTAQPDAQHAAQHYSGRTVDDSTGQHGTEAAQPALDCPALAGDGPPRPATPSAGYTPSWRTTHPRNRHTQRGLRTPAFAGAAQTTAEGPEAAGLAALRAINPSASEADLLAALAILKGASGSRLSP